mmetsp:Transcript_18119/g.40198  ORF Transcript_18119/g.40198 Transcript_18119/m.40198 type:complete len:244 (+) Transcript_18119:1506-2237(+)
MPRRTGQREYHERLPTAADAVDLISAETAVVVVAAASAGSDDEAAAAGDTGWHPSPPPSCYPPNYQRLQQNYPDLGKGPPRPLLHTRGVVRHDRRLVRLAEQHCCYYLHYRCRQGMKKPPPRQLPQRPMAPHRRDGRADEYAASCGGTRRHIGDWISIPRSTRTVTEEVVVPPWTAVLIFPEWESVTIGKTNGGMMVMTTASIMVPTWTVSSVPVAETAFAPLGKMHHRSRRLCQRHRRCRHC